MRQNVRTASSFGAKTANRSLSHNSRSSSPRLGHPTQLVQNRRPPASPFPQNFTNPIPSLPSSLPSIASPPPECRGTQSPGTDVPQAQPQSIHGRISRSACCVKSELLIHIPPPLLQFPPPSPSQQHPPRLTIPSLSLPIISLSYAASSPPTAAPPPRPRSVSTPPPSRSASSVAASTTSSTSSRASAS